MSGAPQARMGVSLGGLRSKAERRDCFSRGLALALEGSPGTQELGGKGLSNKLSTPTAFSMPTHRPQGVCSVELGKASSVFTE